MKNKIAAGVMLSAGSVCVIICLIKNASLETMLLWTFISMFVFMIIGFIAQNIINKMNEAADLRLKEEAEIKRQEEALLKAAKEEEERLEKERLQAEEDEANQKALEAQENDIKNSVIAAGISAAHDVSTNTEKE